MTKKLHQYIDGIDSINLKNYLFCQKNNIPVKESEINIIVNPYIDLIRGDARCLIRMESILNKSFESITLTDLLSLETNTGVFFKYKNIISNIFFRYFNIKLIEDIFDAAKLSKQQIQLKYGGTDSKCESISGKIYNSNEYVDKYAKNNDIIVLGRSSKYRTLTLKHSVDFAVLLIDNLLDSNDPYKTFSNLCNTYNVKHSFKSLKSVKTFTKNKTFYRNYKRHLNSVVKNGYIKYKGEKWKISKIYTDLPFLYYIWLTVKGEIPGRKWDKKLGVVKTDE